MLHQDWRVILCAFAFLIGALAALGREIYPPADIPPLFIAVILTFGSLATFWLYRSAREWQWLALALLCGIISFALGRITAEALPPPLVERDTFVSLKATLLTFEDRIDQPPRLTFKVNQIDRIKALEGHKIRLVARTDIEPRVRAGCSIELKAVLLPAQGPAVPGGYDFAAHARLEGIAAQGFATSAIAPANDDCLSSSLLENTRRAVAKKIQGALPLETAGIAVALITGDRSGIDQGTRQTLRDAGLSHLLAISGLHMALVTGAAFFLFEFLFAAIPAIAYRILPRKLAALFAFMAATAYLLLSGAGVATVRAYIMVVIAMIALLTDRHVISLRSLAFAAIIIIALSPEVVLSISFHMSFAATAALICFYEYMTRRPKARERGYQNSKGRRWGRAAIVYVGAVAASSAIAQFAVAPLALYHFQSVSLLGTVANLVAIPLMAFVIMPSALLAMLLLPIAPEVGFWLMGQGIALVLDAAHITASLPFSTLYITPFTPHFILAVIAAFFCLTVLKGRLSLICFTAMLLTAGALSREKIADILITGSQPIIAAKGHDSLYHETQGRRGQSSFRETAWKQYWGLKPDTETQLLKRSCFMDGCTVTLPDEGKREAL